MSRIIISYWIDILRKGWIKTKDKIGISGVLLDFFLAFGGTFLYHYFNQDGSYGFGEIFLGFALFVGIILAVLFLHVFIEPAIQDSEQKEIISKNEISDLQVGIGEEYDFEKSGKIYLAFQSFYED